MLLLLLFWGLKFLMMLTQDRYFFIPVLNCLPFQKLLVWLVSIFAASASPSLSLSRSLLSLQHDHVGVCHHLELNEDVNWCRCHWRWWIWNGFCWEMSNLGCVRSSCLKFASSSSGLVQLVRQTCKPRTALLIVLTMGHYCRCRLGNWRSSKGARTNGKTKQPYSTWTHRLV